MSMKPVVNESFGTIGNAVTNPIKTSHYGEITNSVTNVKATSGNPNPANSGAGTTTKGPVPSA